LFEISEGFVWIWKDVSALSMAMDISKWIIDLRVTRSSPILVLKAEASLMPAAIAGNSKPVIGIFVFCRRLRKVIMTENSCEAKLRLYQSGTQGVWKIRASVIALIGDT